MIDGKAKSIADKVYNWATSLSKIEDINKLRRVKHPQPSKEYENFLNNMKLGTEE
jgi:hypothetical protein